MGSSPSPPSVPDPTATANAQASLNKETALYDASLGNVNQVTPYGNLTYSLGYNGASSPTYNYDAYNKALAAYNAAPAATSSTQSNNGYPVNSALGGGVTQGENAGSSTAKPPQLSDYQISAGNAGLPQYTSTIQLSPAQQQILDNQQNLQTQAQGIAGTALNQAQSNISHPYDLSGITPVAGSDDINGYSDKITQALMSRLQPQLDRDQEQLDTKLANQGITQGSDAYNNAINLQNQAKNDAYNQAQLSAISAGQTFQNESLAAHQQGVSDYNTQYYAPLNTYNELANGVQVQNPTFSAPTQGNAASPNLEGDVNSAYQAALNSYNAQVAGSNSSASGLFGLGGSFLGNSSLFSGIGSLFGSSTGLSSGALALAGF